jgi:hypothetical protein
MMENELGVLREMVGEEEALFIYLQSEMVTGLKSMSLSTPCGALYLGFVSVNSPPFAGISELRASTQLQRSEDTALIVLQGPTRWKGLRVTIHRDEQFEIAEDSSKVYSVRFDVLRNSS